MTVWHYFWSVYLVIGALHAMRGYVLVARKVPEIKRRHVGAFLTMMLITISWPYIFFRFLQMIVGHVKSRDET